MSVPGAGTAGVAAGRALVHGIRREIMSGQEIFDGFDSAVEARTETLLRIRPARGGVTSLQTFENVLEALGEGHVYSLETVSSDGQTDLMVRTIYPERVAQHVASHYPGSEIDRVPADSDPMMMREGETGYRHVLHPSGDEWLPFQVYDDREVRDGGDRFIDVLGGMMGVDLRAGERLVSRNVLRQQPHDWSEAWRTRALSGTGGENQAVADQERRRVAEEDNERRERRSQRERQRAAPAYVSNSSLDHDIVLAATVGAIILGAVYFMYQLWDSDKMVLFWLCGLGVLVLCGVAPFILKKMGMFKKKEEPKYYDPDQVRIRISGSAFEAEVHTVVFMGASDASFRQRAMQLLTTVNGVYRGFDNPLGARFAVEDIRELRRDDSSRLPRAKDGWDVLEGELLGFASGSRRYGLFGKQPAAGVIGVKEVVALWHIPGDGVEVAGLSRAQSKLLAAPAAVLEGDGAIVGVSRDLDGGKMDIRFPAELKGRHHLYVARTRQGKSTLMCHVASEELLSKALWRNSDSLVVVDPHSDLINEIVGRIPPELASRVALLDLGGINRRVGVNLLDTRVFDDRDAAVAAVIDVAKGIWDNWGNRMETILSYSLKAMYEANRELSREGQLTMLDTAAMLTDDNFRAQVLVKVKDPFILEWWQSSHGGWSDDYGKDAIAPVLTRMANYSGSEVVRSILGQRCCTLNIREVIERGDVLLVNTNQSAVGPEVASLVGASILKLVDTFVRKQGEIKENETIQRRRVTIIVDEMQSIHGVDFQSMLSEVGKFGGSMILATQSLSRLDELGATMRDSILSNIGVLVSFQVNAVDAERLLPELRSDYLTEADITGLPQHNAYVRVATAGEVQAPFTMEVLPPIREEERMLAVVDEGTFAYSRDGDEVNAQLQGVVEKRLTDYRSELEKTVANLGGVAEASCNPPGEYGQSKVAGGKRGSGIRLDELGGKQRRGRRSR